MIFYESFYEALRELPDEDRLKAYDAICGYGCTGEDPEVSGVVKVIFTLVKPQIDANERRAAGGKKGGRPKKDQTPDSAGDPGENPEGGSGEGESPPENTGDDSEETHKKAGRRKKTDEPRHRYGQNGKVLLSDTDLEKLKAEFPGTWESWVERVDGYCQQMGKTYSDYLQTIRNWAKKDAEKGKTKSKTYKNRFDNFEASDMDYSIFDSM